MLRRERWHPERPAASGGLWQTRFAQRQLEYRTGGSSREEQLYNEQLLRAAVDDWELLRIEVYERELNEREGHKGRSAMIDMSAPPKRMNTERRSSSSRRRVEWASPYFEDWN